MGKKGNNKKPAAGSAAAAAAPAAPAAPSPPIAPTSWEESLELDPEKKAAEEAKKQERQKKAEEAAWQQKRLNEKKEYWAKEAEKETRNKQREDRLWQKEADKARLQGLKEGVVENEDEDASQYTCTLCNKSLNDLTLRPHLDSEAHKKKVAWHLYDATSASACASAMSRAALAAHAWGDDWQLEEWQEKTAEGYIRCVPCGKVIDEVHIAKADHQSRLESWLHQREIERKGYPAPDLPYLALVPADDNPAGPRWHKCLLCKKWCQDETSHTGTHKQPAGSKEHQKNLRNSEPGDEWYHENVTQVRLHWHPGSAPAPAPVRNHWRPASAKAPGAPAPAPAAQALAPAAPTPAAEARAARASVKWGPVGRAAHAAAERARAMKTVQKDPPLPSGWESTQDPSSGKTYYWHTDSNVVQWEHPAAMAAPVAPAQPAPAASAAAPAASRAAAPAAVTKPPKKAVREQDIVEV